MKLYTNTLEFRDLHEALPEGIRLRPQYVLHEGPRVRVRRFEKIRLYSPVSRAKSGRYTNSGTRGAESGMYGDGWAYFAATWDEHGEWMARLFDKDPRLRIVGSNTYDGFWDFHRKTEFKYPYETCGVMTCEKCYPSVRPHDLRGERRRIAAAIV